LGWSIHLKKKERRATRGTKAIKFSTWGDSNPNPTGRVKNGKRGIKRKKRPQGKKPCRSVGKKKSGQQQGHSASTRGRRGDEREEDNMRENL